MVPTLHQYIILIFLIILLPLVFALLFKLEPVHRIFLLDDESIGHELKNDTVSNSLAIQITFVSSFLFVGIFCILSPTKIQSIFSCLICQYFGFLTTRTIAQLLKISVGRLRPDFLQRCIPDQEDIRIHKIEDMKIFGQLLRHDFKCTGEAQIVKEGRMSFPSAHASTLAYTFAFCIFLAFSWSYEYFVKLKVNEQNDSNDILFKQQLVMNQCEQKQPKEKKQMNLNTITQNRNKTRKSLLLTISLIISSSLALISLFTSISRISDNKHNISDVICGFILGVVGGIISGFAVYKNIFGNLIYY